MRMVNQTAVNGSQRGSSPSAKLGRNISGFAGDLITLIELQCKLFAVDLNEGISKSALPTVLILVGLILGLGACPVVLTGIGWVLVASAGLSESAAFLLAGTGALVLAGGFVYWGYYRLKLALKLFTRSKQELTENVQWIKQTLKQHHA